MGYGPDEERYLANLTVELLSAAEWAARLAACAVPAPPASPHSASWAEAEALHPGEPPSSREVHLLGYAGEKLRKLLGTFRRSDTQAADGPAVLCNGPAALRV